MLPSACMTGSTKINAEEEKNMPEKITLDPVQQTDGLFAIASQISVCGDDVDRMKLLRDGLRVMKQYFIQQKEEEHGAV